MTFKARVTAKQLYNPPPLFLPAPSSPHWPIKLKKLPQTPLMKSPQTPITITCQTPQTPITHQTTASPALPFNNFLIINSPFNGILGLVSLVICTALIKTPLCRRLAWRSTVSKTCFSMMTRSDQNLLETIF